MNNVGTSILKDAVDFSAEDFSTILSTNFESGYHLCQLGHPLLKASNMEASCSSLLSPVY